jgi:hypothetical protein
VSTVIRRFVVTGPAGSGKTTWVEKRRQPGDLVFDLDAIALMLALTPHYPRPTHVVDALLAMREALVGIVEQDAAIPCFLVLTDEQDATRMAARLGAELICLRGVS